MRLADWYIENGSLEKADQFLDKAFELNPYGMDLYLTRAGLKAQEGKISGAISDIHRALNSGFANLEFLLTNPKYSKLRVKKRFQRMLNQFFPSN
jgi:Tfp pilus assembly protein PilF